MGQPKTGCETSFRYFRFVSKYDRLRHAIVIRCSAIWLVISNPRSAPLVTRNVAQNTRPSLHVRAFVACSINAGEGLVKLSHVVWRTWTCGGVVQSFCTAVKRLPESKKRCQDCLMSSAQSFYGPCLQSVAHSFTCCFSGNVPLLHTSRYVIPRDSVLPGPPRGGPTGSKGHKWNDHVPMQA